MARFKKGWSDQDHAEFDALVDEVKALDGSTAERGERFMELIDDAIQAHRMWARDVARSSRMAGFKSVWYRIQRRGSKTVVINGREVGQLEFFDRLSLSQIAESRQYARQMRDTYGETVAMYDKTESFIISAGAKSVPEAEEIHGISLDRWLASEAA